MQSVECVELFLFVLLPKMSAPNINKRPPGLIAPLLRFWHLLGNPPKNTTKGRDLLFNEGIRLLNMVVKIALI